MEVCPFTGAAEKARRDRDRRSIGCKISSVFSRRTTGEFPFQSLVNTGLGKLRCDANAVVDSAVIGRTMVHDADSANTEQRGAAIFGMVQSFLEVVERGTRKQSADLRSDRGSKRLAQQIAHQAGQPL